MESSKGGDAAFNKAKKQHERGVESGRGSLFLGVFRGKASEGLSFRDNYARAVIAIGIPFPNSQDPKIRYKKEFNTWKSVTDKAVEHGDIWYAQQAYRAINQGITCVLLIYDSSLSMGGQGLADASVTKTTMGQ